MGQVFSHVALRNGRVPTSKSFTRAMNDFRAACGREATVRAAVFFGSGVHPERLTCRSDIDALVLCRHAEEVQALNRMNIAAQAASALDVPLNIHVLSFELAKTDVHDVSGTLLNHLRRHSGNEVAHIKGEVLSHIAPHRTAPQTDMITYTSAKYCKLKNGLARLGSLPALEQLRLLQKCLEAPVQVARKHLEVLRVLKDDDSKPLVRQRYAEVVPNGLRLAFESAADGDEWYSLQLERQLKAYDKAVYDTVLQFIVEKYAPHVLVYLHAVLMVFSKMKNTASPQ